MVKLTSSGNFNNTENFLNRVKDNNIKTILSEAAMEGVKALSQATPEETGTTANSWAYEIEASSGGYAIHWTNSNINKNVNIALIIQMGHGTRNGGYVQGVDYINPAMAPVFDNIAEKVWKEVTRQ